MRILLKLLLRALAATIAACFILATLYVCVIIFVSWKRGYSWQEMDWDSNGTTTIVEFLMAEGIGKREVGQDGSKCVEYFAYKDGRTIKTTCPGKTTITTN